MIRASTTHAQNRPTQEPEIHIPLVVRYPMLDVMLPAAEGIASGE